MIRVTFANVRLRNQMAPVIFVGLPPHPPSTLFPYTTLFRSLIAWPYSASNVPVITCTSWIRDRSIFTTEALSRSEEHTSELQSHHDLVCRLLLEKKNTSVTSQMFREQYADVFSGDERWKHLP